MFGKVGIEVSSRFRIYNDAKGQIGTAPSRDENHVALITIGYSKHKKKRLSAPKYKTLAIFYTIALVLILSRIPWEVWPN